MSEYDHKYYLDDFQKSIKTAMNAGGLFEREDILDSTKFARFPYFNPYDMMGTTYEYVFFTRPDLNLHNGSAYGTINPQLANIPLFDEAMVSWPDAFNELEIGVNPNQPFSPMLYNCRTSSLDLPDIEAGDEETAENMWGTKMVYRRASTASQDNYDFSLEFRDTRWLDLYMFFRLYDAYEERKAFGRIKPKPYYTVNRKIHDQMSVYKFIVAEDNRTLLYWAKLYGVYPKGVPRSAFSSLPADGDFKFTVNFKANWIEDMDPNILIDFNDLSKRIGSFKASNGHDASAGYSGQRNWFSDGPFIQRASSRYRDSRFLLLWR